MVGYDEAARLVGTSRNHLRQACRDGYIKLVDGLVYVESAIKFMRERPDLEGGKTRTQAGRRAPRFRR